MRSSSAMLLVCAAAVGCASQADHVLAPDSLDSFVGDRALSDLSGQCSLSSTTATLVLVADDFAYISADVSRGRWYVNDRQCATATLANTRKLVISGSSGDEVVLVDFLSGTFLLGTASGPGITVDLATGTDSLRYRLTANADQMTLGAAAATLGTDAVVDFTYSGIDEFRVAAVGGADVVTATGSTATGDPLGQPLIAYGGDGNDLLRGGAGVDSLYGDDGDDTFHAGSTALTDGAADVMVGGSGTDLADYSARTTNLTLSLDGVANDGPESDQVSADIESITGGAGNDTLTGSSGLNTLRGGSGNDLLTGGDGSDTIYGDAGSDSFLEGASTNGSDVFSGGAGTDVLSYTSRSASLSVTIDGRANDGESGELDNAMTDVETLLGGSVADTLTGSSGSNTIFGGGGADTLSGGDGADWLDGEAGDDTLSGGAGDDTLDADVTSSGADVYVGGSGLDFISYASRTASLTISLDGVANDGESGETDSVSADIESIMGGSGNDVLTGGSGNERLEGGSGDDTLTGGAGDDLLVGGAGNDAIAGGTGDGDLCFNGAGEVVSSCEISVATINASDPDPLCAGAASANAPYAFGSGSMGDPYFICTAAQLNAIGSRPGDWGGYFILGANINLAGVTWNIIGTSGAAFTGNFNGDGYTISGFALVTDGSYVGFFGNTSGATISEVTLNLGGNVDAGVNSDYVGALVGNAGSGTISNIVVGGTGTVIGNDYVGGAIGMMGSGVTLNTAAVSVSVATTGGSTMDIGGAVGNCDGTLIKVSASGDVTCTSLSTSCGGLVGATMFSANISKSHASGTVTSDGSATGGFSGYCAGVIDDSYSTAAVSGSGDVGGFIGYALSWGNSCRVARTYATGAVSSGGGLIGYYSGGSITFSFWDTTTSGQGGSAAGTGANTTAMTLTDGNSNGRIDIFDAAGWSNAVWDMTPGTYPTLL